MLVDFQDHLNEKLKKLGLQSPFGVFMTNETSRMLECLRHIRSSLQVMFQGHAQLVLCDHNHVVHIVQPTDNPDPSPLPLACSDTCQCKNE